MAVQIRCPACRAGVVVKNANYLVVLNCHSCGWEFLADAEELSAGQWLPETAESDEPWTDEMEPSETDDWQSREDDPAVLMFCPMCGELAPESAPTCDGCGEPLPIDGPRNDIGKSATTRFTRRFRRNARLLGGLWILLAYVLSSQDFWIGGTTLQLTPMLFGGEFTIPEIPLLTTTLICLGSFALVGHFWAIAVGGLLNYLILFLVVWQVNFLSLGLITVSIVLTHYVLHHASVARSE
ncbi:MAG: hypothetical protein KDA84_27205 [Planctomycetaceae bacterium]|nr:hypothetical protein [Planctomycetaceae bacterium]